MQFTQNTVLGLFDSSQKSYETPVLLNCIEY